MAAGGAASSGPDESVAHAFRDVRGQSRAVHVLCRAIERGRLASAYLLEGPPGVGKERLARALAKAVLGAGEAPAARIELERRIEAGAHPDVRVLRPRAEGNRNLPVQTVREDVLPFAQYAPFEAKAAFLVFPDADVSFPEAHPEAANAMLKTLEEPRPNVHFLLLAARPERLLVTIRSRCQRLGLARLTDDVLDAILAERGVEATARRSAIALADGRADRAIELSEAGAADGLLALALRLDGAIASGRPGAAAVAAEEIARAESFGRVIEALAAFYRDVASAALGRPDEALSFASEAAVIRGRAERIGAARAADACALLREIEETLAQNANKELALARLAAALS